MPLSTIKSIYPVPSRVVQLREGWSAREEQPLLFWLFSPSLFVPSIQFQQSFPLPNCAASIFVRAEVEEALSVDLSFDKEFERFKAAAARGNLVPLYERVMGDQLTPVGASMGGPGVLE